jgi:serine/threonine-protein kinase HipA
MNLSVCLDGQLAGSLETRGVQASFTYAESWLSQPGPYPLSLSLPLQPSAAAGASVINFLWGLLPDNERTLDAWARQFRVSARNAAALLAHVGEDCAGAVQIVGEDRLSEVLASAKIPPQVEWLSDADFEQRIRRLAGDAAAGRSSTEEGQFSLAGAQSKTALHFDERRKRWGVPRGRTPTTHILKPVTNDFDGFAENEHFCLELARRIGLAAAETRWESIGAIPTLIVKRYDRVLSDRRWHRIHQEDFCQALGIHPGSKYESDGGPGFARLMAMLDGSDEPEADRDRLMRVACFLYLVAATDAHAKNFSILHARGADRPSMRLAPFYDIASAWPYGRALPAQKLQLAMRVGTHCRIRDIVPRHFEDLARACRYPPDRILETLRELSESLPDQAATLAAELKRTTAARGVIGSLVDGIAAQATRVSRQFAHT